MKPRKACVHYYLLEPDRFLGYVTGKTPGGNAVGQVYATKGKCKKCGARWRGRYVRWPLKGQA
jgi:hypothetical protein